MARNFAPVRKFRRRYRRRGRRYRSKYPSYHQVYNMIEKKKERKQFSQALTTNFGSVGNTWAEVDVMSTIAQGDTVYSRDGAQIMIHSFLIRGILAAGDTTNVLRLVVALWDSATATPCATLGNTIDTVINRDVPGGAGLIRKYIDRYICIDTVDSLLVPIRIFWRFFRPLRVHFAGAAATTAHRKLIISLISDSGVVAHPGFTHGVWYVGFKDC